MAPTATATKPTLSTNERVFAAVDLKGVPAGTPGKVIHVQGLSWIRYWVWFDNGLRMGTIHRDKLSTAAEWERRFAVTEVAAVAAGGAAVAEASGGTALESVGGVPGHLLERSRNARIRLGKPKA